MNWYFWGNDRNSLRLQPYIAATILMYSDAALSFTGAPQMKTVTKINRQEQMVVLYKSLSLRIQSPAIEYHVPKYKHLNSKQNQVASDPFVRTPLLTVLGWPDFHVGFSLTPTTSKFFGFG